MSPRTYTDEQRRALDRRRGATAVDAGAGCGKTFVLTERFLSHLEPTADTPPLELGRIVAITFTDAAAREMRDRIRARCRERLAGAIAAEAPFWRALLRRLDAARVSTIHSFASQLVREHAIALGIDPAFSVLDPAEGSVLLSSAIDETLREQLAPREGHAAEDLIDTAAEFDLRGLRERVRLLAAKSDEPGFSKWLRADPDDLVTAWRAYYRQRVAKEFAAWFLAQPEVEELREMLRIATPSGPVSADRIADLSDSLAGIDRAADPDEALRELRELLHFSDPATGKRVLTAKDWPDGEVSKQFTASAAGLRKLLNGQRRPSSEALMRRAAELSLRVHRLAEAAAKRYRAAKRERGVLDNDDLLVEAHRLLTHPDLTEARNRTASEIDVLLVDEFQDTDRLQSELVQAIVPPGESSDRALFYVGDFKQSIYRFRGAEPGVFQNLRERTPREGRLTLSTNFRSQPAVLDFVNALFGGVFGSAYASLRPQRPQAGPRPAVEFLWTPPPDENGPPDEKGAGAQRRAEAAVIADRLRELLESGEPLVLDKGAQAPRPARPGDIALLFRALSDVAPYEAALREAGLDYYLVGGHTFYAQQEVYDLLNLLKSVQSDGDEIALAGVLRSPFFGLTDEGLFWLANRSGLAAGLFTGSLPRELSEADRRIATHARGTLRELRLAKDRLGAGELLRLAFDATGYDAAVVGEFLGDRKLGNLEKLHEQARAADETGSGLAGFTARLAEFIRNPPKEALASTTSRDADVVRLMTVHASKGLEFPIVVLPDLNRKTQADKSSAAYDPELGPMVRPENLPAEVDDTDGAGKTPAVGLDFWKSTEQRLEREERDRVFYVGCTRAADRLILSACCDPAAKPVGPWLAKLAEHFDLSTGAELSGSSRKPLAAVTPPPAATRQGGRQEGSRLGEAIAAFDSGEVAPPTPAPPTGPIPIRPEERVTYSVSRLSGKLLRGAEPEPEEADPLPSGVDPRRLGNLVHAVLQRLDPQAESQDEATHLWVRALAPRELRRAIPEGARLATELVGRFIASPEWRAMRRARRLLRETEFLLRWPTGPGGSSPAVVRGYFDAVYQDEAGAWHLVDYKTNAVKRAGVPKIAAGYALQMATYAFALEAALGVAPASITLLFLAAGVSHPVAWDAAARAAGERGLSEALERARRRSAEVDE